MITKTIKITVLIIKKETIGRIIITLIIKKEVEEVMDRIEVEDLMDLIEVVEEKETFRT